MILDLSYFFQNVECSRSQEIDTLKALKNVAISFMYARLWTWPAAEEKITPASVSYQQSK